MANPKKKNRKASAVFASALNRFKAPSQQPEDEAFEERDDYELAAQLNGEAENKISAFDIQIDYSEDEKMDFSSLGAIIVDPIERAKQKDLSISFDEDETDDFKPYYAEAKIADSLDEDFNEAFDEAVSEDFSEDFEEEFAEELESEQTLAEDGLESLDEEPYYEEPVEEYSEETDYSAYADYAPVEAYTEEYYTEGYEENYPPESDFEQSEFDAFDSFSAQAEAEAELETDDGFDFEDLYYADTSDNELEAADSDYAEEESEELTEAEGTDYTPDSYSEDEEIDFESLGISFEEAYQEASEEAEPPADATDSTEPSEDETDVFGDGFFDDEDMPEESFHASELRYVDYSGEDELYDDELDEETDAQTIDESFFEAEPEIEPNVYPEEIDFESLGIFFGENSFIPQRETAEEPTLEAAESADYVEDDFSLFDAPKEEPRGVETSSIAYADAYSLNDAADTEVYSYTAADSDDFSFEGLSADTLEGDFSADELLDIKSESGEGSFDSRFDAQKPVYGFTNDIESFDMAVHAAKVKVVKSEAAESVKPVEKKRFDLSGIIGAIGAKHMAEKVLGKVTRAATVEPEVELDLGEAPEYDEDADVKMAVGFSNRELREAHERLLHENDLDNKYKGYSSDDEYIRRAAAADDYDYSDPDGDDYNMNLDGMDDFPSFREFVAQDIMRLVYKFTHKGAVNTHTAEEDDEVLGTEVKPAEAMGHYGRHATPIKNRLRFAAGLLLVMLYFSFDWPLPGMLRSVPTQAAFLMTMQLTMMLIALDVVTNGIVNAVRGKFGADSFAVLACIATALDALLVWRGLISAHVPLCVLSSLAIVGQLFSSMLMAKGLRKTFRVPAIGKKAYTVTAENELTGKNTITALKSAGKIDGFVRRAEQVSPDEWVYQTYGPYALLAMAVIALIVTALTKNINNFVYIFSALIAPAVPFTALLCFALPFFISAMQIFSSGAAIAGWSGVIDLGRSKDIVITDRDIFPEKNIKVKDVRYFNDIDERRFISYAGTMIIASGSCIASSFEDYMKENKISPLPVEGYEYIPGGGLKGIIEGNVVTIGNADLMRLMGVAVKRSFVKPNTIVVAVNNLLYGFIDFEYTPDDSVRTALLKIMQSNRHPVFAIRDFNITPQMIHEAYDVPTDGYDFPSYIERFRLSNTSPEKKNQPAAVLCREGLAPLIHVTSAGRSVYIATRINMCLSLIGALVCMAVAIWQIITTGAVAIPFVTLLSLIFALPVMLVSVFMKI